MFDRKGQPVGPDGSVFSKITPSRYETLPLDWDGKSNPFPDVIAGLRKPDAPRKVLIFIHGGLNEQRETLVRVLTLSEQMKDFYPIFVNWDSSLVSSYFNEHLLRTRQGKEWPTGLGSLWSPGVLAGDIGRGLTRAPLVWLLEAQAALDSLGFVPVLGSVQRRMRGQIPMVEPDEDEVARRTGEALVCRDSACDCAKPGSSEPQISIGRAAGGGGTIGSAVRSLFWLPVRVAISPIVESGGAAAWASMKRRVRLLFNNETEFLLEPEEASAHADDYSWVDRAPESALRRFMRALREEQCGPQGEHASCDRLEITIVGHSMGAIITNELLRVANFEPTRGEVGVPEFKNIVYMAAADSLRSYLESALPYLDRHPETNIYHLTLHEHAEAAERFPDRKILGMRVFDLAPPGSLLVWIDSFLESPDTLLDRTSGRALSLLHGHRYVPDHLHDQIHFKLFPGSGPGVPIRHGDFTDLEFWRESFWKPTCGCEEPEQWYHCGLPPTQSR